MGRNCGNLDCITRNGHGQFNKNFKRNIDMYLKTGAFVGQCNRSWGEGLLFSQRFGTGLVSLMSSIYALKL